MAGGQSAAASGAGGGWSGACMEEESGVSRFLMHDGRAAEPLSALHYVKSTSVSVFRGVRNGPFPFAAESMMRFLRCRNLGETLASR